MGAVTAKVIVSNVSDEVAGEQKTVYFAADYGPNGEKNKEWSRYTPAMTLSMLVKTEIADAHFKPGQSFTLTFTPEEG